MIEPIGVDGRRPGSIGCVAHDQVNPVTLVSAGSKVVSARFPKPRSLGPNCAVWVEVETDTRIRNVADQDVQ